MEGSEQQYSRKDPACYVCGGKCAAVFQERPCLPSTTGTSLVDGAGHVSLSQWWQFITLSHTQAMYACMQTTATYKPARYIQRTYCTHSHMRTHTCSTHTHTHTRTHACTHTHTHTRVCILSKLNDSSIRLNQRGGRALGKHIKDIRFICCHGHKA